MKMSFEIILLIIIVVILAYLFFIFIKTALTPSTQQNTSNSVCIKPLGSAQGKESCFFVELAKTDAERERGLMSRTQLDKNKGMLFIFDKEGVYPFWMKNTLIPLDIIWIDGQGKIVYISQKVQPCKSLICPSVWPTTQAKYVLEINAGTCKEAGIEVGDKVELNIK